MSKDNFSFCFEKVPFIIKESFIGYAEIKEVFKVTGIGRVAGCLVTEGLARRSAGVRLLRDNVVIHEGTLKTLKRFKAVSIISFAQFFLIRGYKTING